MEPSPSRLSEENAPLFLHKSMENDPEESSLDTEVFIRQAFRTDAAKGYELLFNRYYRNLCSHAVRFVLSRQVSEDIVSEVFLNFWKNQVHNSITISYRAYLYGAVRNRTRNYLRYEFKRDSSADEASLDAVTDISETPHQLLQYTELCQEIDESIRQLPPQCQRVFLMSRHENKKYQEIADELNISTKTVENHIIRALSQLRQTVGRYLVTVLLCFYFL